MGYSRILLVALALVSILGQSSSNPIDSFLDPFGLFSSDSASADANAAANNVDNNGEGFSAGLDAANANSFAVDKNLHVPDITGKTDGLDANLGLSGAESFALSKGIHKGGDKPRYHRRPYSAPYAGGPPVVIEEIPVGPPRPQPVYSHGPPPPRPAPMYQNDRHYYQHEQGPYNHGGYSG